MGPMRAWVLVLGFCVAGCGQREPIEASSERQEEGPLPRGFDLPPPSGATLRHAAGHGARATALFTVDAPLEEVLGHYVRAFEARGLRVLRDGSRVSGSASDGELASARVERGLSGLLRVSVEQRRAFGPGFDSGPEPRAWRTIARAPLPAPPGESVRACTDAMRRACEAWARASEQDALSCAMDHRGACVRVDEPGFLLESVRDAEARLLEALRAYDSVVTPEARNEVEALARLELLFADAVRHRARSHLDEAQLSALSARIDRVPIRRIDAEPSAWFAR